MAEALQVQLPEGKKNTSTLEETISKTHTEEIIIGLCGPIGSDIHFIAKQLSNLMEEKFAYECKVIRLSDFIKEQKKILETGFSSKYDYLNALISAGNKLREENGNSILAALAINEIAVQRELFKKQQGASSFQTQRVCYIIDSIKNSDELDLFRKIYTDLFYSIGVFSNLDIRENNLAKKNLKKDEVYRLIDRDSGEEVNFGQKVSKTFVQCDFFLRIEQSTSARITESLSRYLNLIFNSEIISPSENETAMYLAAAAAGNSACLSRQVGASIVNSNGDVISVGWNDVPKASGGLYKYTEKYPLGENDYRCINLEGGKCFNDEEKEFIRATLVDELVKENLIKSEDREHADEVIKKSRIKELIEFSRAVHAEMHALIIASQNSGKDVINGKLYCTTYPCHNCARHIIAAGIREVYYIEPYRKSLAIKLHGDSMTESENETGKVKVLLYSGVSPKRYLEFFKMVPESRKYDGHKKLVDKRRATPKTTLSLQAIPILEKRVIENLQEKKLIVIQDEEGRENA